MAGPGADDSRELADVAFVKSVRLGSAVRPADEEEMERQTAFLNRCLNELPKGWIISKTVSTLTFEQGEHKLTYQQVTFQVGWRRKPFWLEAEEARAGHG